MAMVAMLATCLRGLWIGAKRARGLQFSHTKEPNGCSSVKVLSILPRRIELPTAVIRATAEPC